MFKSFYNALCHLFHAVETTAETIDLAAQAANKTIREEFQLPEIKE